MKISEVSYGMTFEHPKMGTGMVVNVTPRTVTVQWGNGDKVKNTYRSKDAMFYWHEFVTRR